MIYRARGEYTHHYTTEEGFKMLSIYMKKEILLTNLAIFFVLIILIVQYTYYYIKMTGNKNKFS